VTLRPMDDRGDILPVTRSADLVSGARAVALLARCRLRLHRGEWWENPALGSPALALLREEPADGETAARLTEALAAELRAVPGVAAVEEARVIPEGRELLFTCLIETTEGEQIHGQYRAVS